VKHAAPHDSVPTRTHEEVNPLTDRAVILEPKWYTTAQVAELLGFGLYKTKMLIATGELRSLKDGKYRRILPEWVDEYVARRVQENVQ
jgi:excisionase family DNA binding protein